MPSTTANATPISGPDYIEARAFLLTLDPAATKWTFQVFDDDQGRKNQELARIIHASLDDAWPQLVQFNYRGAGVFVTINETDFQGRAIENMGRVRATWADWDEGRPATLPLEPSMVVATSPGKWQAHWLSDGLSHHDHKAVMARMVTDHKADASAKDLSRVLRVPGFFHRKGKPFLVTVESESGRRYSRAEILQAFGVPDLPATDAPQKPPASPTAPLCELDLWPALRDAFALLAQTPPMAEHEERDGGWHGKVKGRNRMVYALVGKMKRLGLSLDKCTELAGEWNEGCSPPQDEDSLSKTIRSSYARENWTAGVDRPEGEFEPLRDIPGLPAGKPAANAQQLLERVSDINLAELARRRENALVRGILHPREDATMYGESRAGKSFVAVHISYHVALGLPWAGLKVKRAPVLYICLEGVDGFRERMLAAAGAYGDPGLWFARLTVPVSLDKTADGAAGGKLVIDAAKKLEADCGQPVGLIIVDTRARATPGDDEIKASDLMAYARRVAEIAGGTGAAILTIDHTNEHGELRGAKPKGAAADVLIHVTRNQDGTERSVLAKKVKDGSERTLFDFGIRSVPLGSYADGETFGSAVIETTAPKPKDEQDKGVRREVARAYAAAKDRLGTSCVPLVEVATEFKAAYITESDDPAAAKRNAWGNVRRKELWPTGVAVTERDGIAVMGPLSRTPRAQDEFTDVTSDLPPDASEGR